MGNRAAKILINRLEADENRGRRQEENYKTEIRDTFERESTLNFFCYKTTNPSK
jgi:hypothetical protein